MLTLLNLRNTVDFAVRSRLRWGRRYHASLPIPSRDQKLQSECEAFLRLFPWKEELGRFPNEIVAADIGARNFAFAPVIDRVLEENGFDVELHGIEIDAYRRLADFRTRKDYGDYYASRARKGRFHAMDFLNWERPLHLAFLLNPFVSEEPTLAWGLPLSTLKPHVLFQHVHHALRPFRGLLLLSCPSPEEFEIAFGIARDVGFHPITRKEWTPKDASIQLKPRYGILMRSALW